MDNHIKSLIDCDEYSIVSHSKLGLSNCQPAMLNEQRIHESFLKVSWLFGKGLIPMLCQLAELSSKGPGSTTVYFWRARAAWDWGGNAKGSTRTWKYKGLGKHVDLRHNNYENIGIWKNHGDSSCNGRGKAQIKWLPILEHRHFIFIFFCRFASPLWLFGFKKSATACRPDVPTPVRSLHAAGQIPCSISARGMFLDAESA